MADDTPWPNIFGNCEMLAAQKFGVKPNGKIASYVTWFNRYYNLFSSLLFVIFYAQELRLQYVVFYLAMMIV